MKNKSRLEPTGNGYKVRHNKQSKAVYWSINNLNWSIFVWWTCSSQWSDYFLDTCSIPRLFLIWKVYKIDVLIPILSSFTELYLKTFKLLTKIFIQNYKSSTAINAWSMLTQWLNSNQCWLMAVSMRDPPYFQLTYTLNSWFMMT